jgi:hypothetical protein
VPRCRNLKCLCSSDLRFGVAGGRWGGSKNLDSVNGNTQGSDATLGADASSVLRGSAASAAYVERSIVTRLT